MSKKEWILRAGLWTLRAASRPFVTGSWRKRLICATAAMSGIGGGGYAVKRVYHDLWASPTAAVSPQKSSLAALEPRNGSQREADPLRVDDAEVDDAQSSSNLHPLARSAPTGRGETSISRSGPFVPDSDSGSRRNPAALANSANRSLNHDDDSGGRMRFGGISSRPIRPASDEQPTGPASTETNDLTAPTEEESPAEPTAQLAPALRNATGRGTARGRWNDRFDEQNATGENPERNAPNREHDGLDAGTDTTSDSSAEGSAGDSAEASDDSEATTDNAADPENSAEPNRLNTGRQGSRFGSGSSHLRATDSPSDASHSPAIPHANPDNDPPAADSMRSLRDLPRRNPSAPTLNERRADERRADERRADERRADRAIGPGAQATDPKRRDFVPDGPAAPAPLASGRDRVPRAALEVPSALVSESPGAKQIDGLQTPSLAIEKTAPPEVQVGRPTAVQIKVRNLGKVTAYDVVVHDMLPAGMELQEMQPHIEPGADGSLEWAIGTMNPGAEASLVMKLIPRVEGELGSVAQVSFRTPASVRTVSTRPQVAVQVDFPSSIMIGETATATITVSNSGSGAANNLFLDAVLPEGLAHPAGRELQSPLGNLMPGAKKTISLPLKAVKAGPQSLTFAATNEVNVSAEQSMPLDVIAPELEVRLQGPKTRFLDRQGSYVISLNNPGTAPAEDIELILFLSKGMKFVAANNQGEYDRQSHAVYWNLARLPAGEQGEAQVTLLPSELGQQKVRAEARAARSLRQTDERQIQVEGFPELQFSVSDTEDPIDVGGETTYEILITNKGSQAASNIELSVDFPVELEPQRGTGPVAVRVTGPQAVSDPIPQLAPGEKAVFKVTARGIRSGDSRVRVHIVSDDLRNPVTKEERTVVHEDDR